MLSEYLQPAAAELFYTRGDPDDPRLGEIVQRLDVGQDQGSDLRYHALLLGIPDDRGIEANRGRPGAKEAPDAIRRALYRFTPGADGALTRIRCADPGNLRLADSIEETHERAVAVVRDALLRSERVITLGGGHDLAYCDLRALIESATSGGAVGIINLDAHLDVRPDTNGINSGTAFYRIFQLGKRELGIGRREGSSPTPNARLVEFGIQRQANARKHLEWVQEQRGQVRFWDEISAAPVAHFARELEELSAECEMIGLSLDVDSIRMSDAPGVSAPSPVGFSAGQMIQMIRLASACPKVKTLGIFEVSPPLDVGDCTSRLAALCVYEFLSGTGY